MANVLVVPASGSIIFDSQTAGSSTISPLSTAPRISYDNAGGINIQSYVTATSALDRFTVDGTNGRLFSVSDALTGSIFSVNDISGLPIIEVNSGVTDVITMGTYGTNALVVSGGSVGIGTATPTAKLDVRDTWNNAGTTFTAVKADVTDTSSNAASLLMDLRVGGGTPVSKFSVKKNGVLTLNNSGTITWTSADDLTFSSGLAYQRVRSYSFWASNLFAGIGDNGTPASAAVHLANSQFVGWTSGAVINLGTYDTFIGRDNAANTLAQRNGTNPQEFRLYNTYTDASNYERFFIKTNVGATSATQIGLSAGGSGQNRNLEFVAGGSTKMTIASSGLTTLGGNLNLIGNTLNINSTNTGGPTMVIQAGGQDLIWGYNSGAWGNQPLMIHAAGGISLGNGGNTSPLFYRYANKWFGVGVYAETGPTGSIALASLSASGNITGNSVTAGGFTTYGDSGYNSTAGSMTLHSSTTLKVGDSMYTTSGNRKGIQMPNDSFILFNSTNNAYAGAIDVAIRRSAAGIVEVNSGTAGTLRDMSVRSLSASGTIYSGNSAVVVSPTIVSIQAVTSSQYSALVSAGQALSSVLYLVQDP